MKRRDVIEELILLPVTDETLGYVLALAWAERFHYIGPTISSVDRYVQENAVSI